MLYLLAGFLVLGLLLGVSGMRRMGRLAGRAWRPGAGILALGAFAAAAFMGLREQFAGSVFLALIGLWLTMSVRRTARVRHGPPPPPAVSLGRSEAASILGVAPDASEAEVQAAYHRLIKRAHPDQGGTAGLAAQLNAARDTMLRGSPRA
jgi:hypothetical protein